MTDAYGALATRRVDLWFAGTSPQNRWTVGFRIILAIPQFVVLYFLFVAVLVVEIIGWFGALFMGRLPGWVHEFVSGVVRWATRVGAYMFLLTDRYPPFSFEDEAYPVRPFIPTPGPLNRWAVLFRIFIAIPAGAFYQIVQYGLTYPLLFGAWIAVLITGRMPPPLYLAYAALLRYETRFGSWFGMLTSEYPWGMLGDRSAQPPAVAPPPTFAPPPPTPAAPPVPPTPAPPTEPYAYPAGEAAPSATPEPSPGAPPPAPPSGPPPSPTAGPGAVPPGSAGPPGAMPPGSAGPSGAMPPGSAGPPGAMPPPSPWERVAPASGPGTTLPPWGTLVLEGAARGWMIFGIVWGSVLFVTQGTTQNIVVGYNGHNHRVQYLGAHHGPATTAEGHTTGPR